MKALSWGKPRIFIAPIESGVEGEWAEVKTPVENSTKLTTTKGDKKEAKVEGGENECVKYNRNTYALEFGIRIGLENDGSVTVPPFEEVDGVIQTTYAIKVQPENPDVPGLYIKNAVISLEDTWDAENGKINNYSCDVVKATSGKSMETTVIVTPDNLK